MNNNVIIGMLCLSALFSLAVLGRVAVSLTKFIQRNTRQKSDLERQEKYRSLRSRMLIVSALLFGAVWSLRFAVGYYASFEAEGAFGGLRPAEEVFNSLVHTLQTFSLDEDYTGYILDGKRMIAALFGAGEGAAWIKVYGLYAAVLNILVPVVGGAIILELILEYSPKLRLLLLAVRSGTEKYYFSELNDRSLALASSYVQTKGRSVSIIFTDAYADDEEERGSERLSKAKALGAICLKDDLLHVRFPDTGFKVFLMDESENGNLETLTYLLDHPGREIQKTEIFIFASERTPSDLEEETAFIINRKRVFLMEQSNPDLFTKLSKDADDDQRKAKRERIAAAEKEAEKQIPTVVPINSIRNMVYNLLLEVPLYEPLIERGKDRRKNRRLTVTILGSGAIGTECFLSVYWCGQMLNTSLCINVVSKERQRVDGIGGDGGGFEGRIDYINPEILKTADPFSPLLEYNERKERNEPYFTYQYIESDVFSDDMIAMMKDRLLLETDYFIVALGSDEENFAVADRLRQIMGAHHMREAPEYKTVISYVVYNSDLSRALNRCCLHRYVPDHTPDIYMFAFGDLDDIYSAKEDFFLDGVSTSALGIGKAYDEQKGQLAEQNRRDGQFKRFKDIYSYQSNLTKRIHRKYKEYSVGFHGSSIFETDSQNERDKYKEQQIADASGFIRMMTSASVLPDGSAWEKDQSAPKTLALLGELAWLEHRRWCAYMRTKGFRDPGKLYLRYFDFWTMEHEEGKHQFISLKLHPCLVECSKAGIQAAFDDRGFIVTESEMKYEQPRDYLDCLSLSRFDAAHKKRGTEDFKRWDYPEFEFDTDEIRRALNKPANDAQTGSEEERKSGEKKEWSVVTGGFSELIDIQDIYWFDGKNYITAEMFEAAAVKRYRTEQEAAKAARVRKRRAEAGTGPETISFGKETLVRIEGALTCPCRDPRAAVEMIELSNADLYYERLLKQSRNAVPGQNEGLL